MHSTENVTIGSRVEELYTPDGYLSGTIIQMASPDSFTIRTDTGQEIEMDYVYGCMAFGPHWKTFRVDGYTSKEGRAALCNLDHEAWRKEFATIEYQVL